MSSNVPSPTTAASVAHEFTELLLDALVLTFGDFVLKSGRRAPYFLNFGNISSGFHLEALGSLYARHIQDHFGSGPYVLFGPAYKGIPLAAATAISLSRLTGTAVPFSANRKERKTHGEGSAFLGHVPRPGDRIIIVEDVVTAGSTFREVVPLLKGIGAIDIVGAILGVDRCERGMGGKSARREMEEEFHLPIRPLVTIRQILEILPTTARGATLLTPELRSRIDSYLAEFGAE